MGWPGLKPMIKTNGSYGLPLWLLWLAALLGAPVQAETPAILVLGDSLSAAYGIPAEQGWVSLLQRRLAERGFPHRVVNASISGDTTSGGLSRLPAALTRDRPTIVIVELGANDGLRGQPLMAMTANLARIIELSQQAGAQVMLTEMRIPPNYGPLYTQKFQATFSELAKRHDITLIPFLLEGVAGNPALIQEDGLHPRTNAQPRILDNVWPVLEPVLK
ncbi:multifunctional: acyl-CoA thioesterase I; protease I; lysophospholipaseL(I) [Candidatus Contendobacter odensis Run_B_J11]|uniref:Multifunctional: acyl-CoA thioesterase I protease I lysophospholipaseL(I) n=2 Tax=Candidatus Contendibacter odensensis TaxID=1400860 RepID=A0A7U7G803_9GAMM|nr:multifunctional: acyl-CoA thioesterase I; protease I; lysophospholipaseL(I) [Candidatus Contendobacter odensis Run_B_J11]